VNGAPSSAAFTLTNVGDAVELAASLGNYISSLIASGQMSNGVGTSLINAYLKKITDTFGISLIDSFITQVQKDVAQGKISQAIGNTLINDALVIRSELTS
jgi:hypothetical protein